MKVILYTTALCLLAMATKPASAATCTWTGGTSNWNNTVNWDCGVVPDADDDVIIDTGEVTLDISTSVGAFTMSSGKLVGANVLTITGLFTWTGGEIELEEGSAASDVVASDSTSFFGSDKTLGGATTIQLDGNASWTGGAIIGTSGSVLTINASFEQTTSSVLTWSGIVPSPRPKVIIAGDYAFNATSTITFFWSIQIDGSFTFQTGGGGLVINGTDVTINGTVDVADASMVHQGTPLTITSTGIVQGVGTLSFGVFSNSGTFRPGSSPGVMSITAVNSTYTNGTLDIELDSYLGAGTGHDQLDIDGPGDLSGTLNITHTGGFTPVPGDVFTIMKCTSGCTTSLNAPTTQPVGYNYGVASMGDSIVVGPDLDLPIELVDFEATVDENDVVLSWQTASESNNSGFEIQAQAVGKKAWSVLDFVDGNGSSREIRHYVYRALKMDSGTWRFRLRQVDFDGSFTYSPIVEVVTGLRSGYEIMGAYPNPFRETAHLELVTKEREHVRVAVFDIRGREVAIAFDELMVAGTRETVLIDASAWPSGLYMYRVTGETFTKSGTMLKVK